MSISHAIFHDHASENTKFHALYCYFLLRKTKSEIAEIFGKSPSTITNWIERYEQEGDVGRHQSEREGVYDEAMKSWMLEQFISNHLLYLVEAKIKFTEYWGISISLSTIWNILHSGGFTRKAVERRAIEAKESDIVRFALEINQLSWSPENLVFLDEVSFDNRGMLRKRGYSIRGK